MIRVEGLTKTFTANREVVTAVAAIDFEVGAGEMVTLLGPSGCGKTTTLRCVAGLEKPDGGRISTGDRTVVDVAAHDRAGERRLRAGGATHQQSRAPQARDGGA